MYNCTFFSGIKPSLWVCIVMAFMTESYIYERMFHQRDDSAVK